MTGKPPSVELAEAAGAAVRTLQRGYLNNEASGCSLDELVKNLAEVLEESA